jgi:uncharacterized NAD(P)/FAD-binding protein YdhS
LLFGSHVGDRRRALTDTDQAQNVPLRIAVIGGGFTGAVFVIHALKSTQRALDIVVIEPSAELGRGTAYGTDDPKHRINVPSDRMALSAGDPNAATRWFIERGILPDADCDDGQGWFYVSRQAYGAFVSDALREALDGARGRVNFKHLRAKATRIERRGETWQVTTDGHGDLNVAVVVCCFGHAAPAPPCPIGQDVTRSPKFVPDPWADRALSRIGHDDSVLVIGTGLTMADVVASLLATERNGPITAISRRGLMPRGHGQFVADFDLFQSVPPPRTALGLLRLLRRRIRESGPSLGWQPVVDALRAQLPVVWRGLPEAEQRLVLRHLLPFWEVHRFRIAPQVSTVLAQARANGGLSVERAGLVALTYEKGQYAAAFRRPNGRVEERKFDAVVLCTGPDRDLAANPLIKALLAEKTARLDRTGIGLAVDPWSRVIDAQGRPDPTLLALGPMTRGSFGEMTGAPDIARHTENVVQQLLA